MRHKPEPSPIGLLSVEAAAEFLGGLSPSTIGRLTRVKVGSRTMIRESELLTLIQPEGKRK